MDPVTETELATAAVAPRVTQELLESRIVERIFLHPTERLMICVLVLANGFTVTGESSCVYVENYDEEIGRRIAFNNAFSKMWELEGYVLRNTLKGI